MPIQCTHCGFENPAGFAFCGRCGARLSAPPPGLPLDARQAQIQQLKEAADAAQRDSNPALAVEKYQQALSLLDSSAMSADATLHVQFVKQRYDILAERVPLWATVGQADRVEPDLQEMLALARRAGDGGRLSKAITALARFYLLQGRNEPARPLLEEAVSLLRSQSDRAGEAAALADLARSNWRGGKFDNVANALQRAHELRRGIGDPAGLARSYFDLGVLYLDGLSQPYHAANHFEKSMEFARLPGDAELEARALIAIGASRTRLGDYTHARAALDEARRKIADTSSADQPVRLAIAQADLLREIASADAPGAASQAVALAAERPHASLQWRALVSRALTEQAIDHWAQAESALQQAQALGQADQLHAYCAIWVDALLARSHLHLDRRELAGETSARAVTVLEKHGAGGVPVPQTILWIHFEVLNQAKDPTAIHFLRQARETMLAQANTIGDGGIRARFLRDVIINRAIGDDWAKAHA